MDRIKYFFIKRTLNKLFGEYADHFISYIKHENKKFKDAENKICGYVIINVIGNKSLKDDSNKIAEYFRRGRYISIRAGNIVHIVYYKPYINKNTKVNIEYLRQLIENIPEDTLKNYRGVYGMANTKIYIQERAGISMHRVLVDNYIEKIIKIDKLKYGEFKCI
jgi:ribosomal protein S17E